MKTFPKQPYQNLWHQYIFNRIGIHHIQQELVKWFRKALGFTRNNINDLSSQIVFDSKKAIQTVTTDYQIKYNQVIRIVGLNEKIIDVLYN